MESQLVLSLYPPFCRACVHPICPPAQCFAHVSENNTTFYFIQVVISRFWGTHRTAELFPVVLFAIFSSLVERGGGAGTLPLFPLGSNGCLFPNHLCCSATVSPAGCIDSTPSRRGTTQPPGGGGGVEPHPRVSAPALTVGE